MCCTYPLYMHLHSVLASFQRKLLKNKYVCISKLFYLKCLFHMQTVRQTHIRIHTYYVYVCVCHLKQLFQMPSSSLWAPRTEPTAINKERERGGERGRERACKRESAQKQQAARRPLCATPSSLEHLICRRERQTERKLG